MSSETITFTVATQKRHNSATYWAFFTKGDSAFWNFVDRSRDGLKPQGSPAPQSEQPQKNAPCHPIEWWRFSAAH